MGQSDGGDRGKTYPCSVQDELAVGLVVSDGLCSQTCGTRVKLEDVGRHGSTGGAAGRF